METSVYSGHFEHEPYKNNYTKSEEQKSTIPVASCITPVYHSYFYICINTYFYMSCAEGSKLNEPDEVSGMKTKFDRLFSWQC